MKVTKILHLVATLATFVPSFALADGGIAVTLSIVNHNVHFPSKTQGPEDLYNSANSRAGAIVNSDYIRGQDVVVLEGCFDNKACSVLIDGLKSRYPFRTPTVGDTTENKGTWDSTQGAPMTRFENGGIFIFSKWPILTLRQTIYKATCGADVYTNKGIAYAKLDHLASKTPIHIFGTDMQSNEESPIDTDIKCANGVAVQARQKALKELRAFIDEQNIPTNEPVIMVGGFNIEKDTEEFGLMLTALDASQPTTYEGNQWTWDTKTNEIASRLYSSEQSKYIDFVLTDKKHKAANSSTQTCLQEKYGYLDDRKEYSDHYPVQAKISFDLT
ncbi:hypothetical protein BGZ98_004955 [Dissophora globulifera]|nr:hypothetical protein BGZ98_004955 [Dissophora globulifera]